MEKLNKWLIFYNDQNELQIDKKDLSVYIPINRMLDKTGFYKVDRVVVDKRVYLITSKPEESLYNFSMLLVARVLEDQSGDKLIDMSDEDLTYVEKIADKLLKKRTQQAQA